MGDALLAPLEFARGAWGRYSVHGRFWVDKVGSRALMGVGAVLGGYDQFYDDVGHGYSVTERSLRIAARSANEVGQAIVLTSLAGSVGVAAASYAVGAMAVAGAPVIVGAAAAGAVALVGAYAWDTYLDPFSAEIGSAIHDLGADVVEGMGDGLDTAEDLIEGGVRGVGDAVEAVGGFVEDAGATVRGWFT